MNIATYEQVEEVLNNVTFEQQVAFIKRILTPEQIEETYGPRVLSDDPILDYLAEYSEWDITLRICVDHNKENDFHDWILQLSKTGYGSYK